MDGIDLQVPGGVVLGLLGANGAGKTTLISILCGLLERDAGEVSIAGLDPQTHGPQVRMKLSLVPQSFAFYPALSVEENLSLFASLTGRRLRPDIDRTLESTGLSPYADRRAAHLSGGLQRRLNLAIGLLGERPVLLLDEPTAGVDPATRNFIVDQVRRLASAGRTVIYTSHYLDEIERACDHIAILDQGRVVCHGEKQQLLTGHTSLDALFLKLTRQAVTA